MLFMGIDTSCYTTSIALLNAPGGLLDDRRIVLPVPAGEKGLKQSTALFFHWRNLPALMSEALTRERALEIAAIAVSARPRPCEESYMPVFSAGTALAESIASLLGVPLVKTSHQEGHIMAGLWSAGVESLKSFLVLHLSGGTTELLKADKCATNPLRFKLEVMGGSTDIQAGQLIDRVGVAMGLSFPSGRELEKTAATYNTKEKLPVIPSSVKECQMSFSGAETLAKAYLRKNYPLPAVARAVEHCIATSVEKALRRAVLDTGTNEILLVGGVAGNSYIRSRLIKRLEHQAVGARMYFPDIKHCSDNAVGAALIARSIVN